MKRMCGVLAVCAAMALSVTGWTWAEEGKSPSPAVQKALDTIIPRVDLQEASLRDVVKFLTEQGKVNVVLLEPGSADCTVTLSLKDIPLKEALKYVAELIGLDIRTDEHAVVLYRKQQDEKAGFRNVSTDLQVAPAENGAYLIKAKIKEGEEVLSAPQIVVMPGQEGTIRIGQDTNGKESGLTVTVLATETNRCLDKVETTFKLLERGEVLWQSRQEIVLALSPTNCSPVAGQDARVPSDNSQGVEVQPHESEPSPASESDSPDLMSDTGKTAAKAGDSPAPVIMSDYETWTIVGATARQPDPDCVWFSDGIGIADRSGSWITADQGDVVLSSGVISGFSLRGNALLRARPEASMSDVLNALQLLQSGGTREISVSAEK